MHKEQPDTLVGILRRHAQLKGDRLACTFLVNGEDEEQRLTYRKLDRRARAVAVYLQEMGMRGERVLLLQLFGPDYVAAFLGCLYAGAIAVPAYPPRKNRSLKKIEHIVDDANVRLAIISKQTHVLVFQEFKESGVLRTLPVWTMEDLDETKADQWQEPGIHGDDIAFLQYTSGSTGTPKGVIVSHGNIMHNERMIQEGFDQDESVVVVTWLPLYHDMGLIGNLLQPLYLGVHTVLMSPEAFIQKPLRWLKAITRYKATTTGGPNFAYDLCVSAAATEGTEGIDLSSWRVACNGSEPVRVATMARFANKFAGCGFRKESFYPCYGMAEATLLISGGRVASYPTVKALDTAALAAGKVRIGEPGSEHTQLYVSCGFTQLQQKLLIVNPETGEKGPEDQVGEVWIAGANVSKGYWNNPALTAAAFQARVSGTGEGPFFRTGDLGFVQDGELYITGRLKDMIIIRGGNYYPQDIEQSVENCHPALRAGAGAAFGVEIDGQEQLVIVQEVERTAIRTLDVKEVVGAIREAVAELHGLEVHAIQLLKTLSIPKTSSGKIQRHACRDRFLAGTLEVITESRAAAESTVKPSRTRGMQFSLLYFSGHEAPFSAEKYKLVLEGARFADANDFTAVWLPERHFHPFGGLFPSPSVVCAALAMITRRVRLRAGSVVLPLHMPVRVAEEWSVVDNLSGGRVDIAFARGWNANDFVLSPETYSRNKEILYERMRLVQQLWRGESVSLPNGEGKHTSVRIYPLPRQQELPTWITCSGGPERFAEAGACGANVLTALLFQSTEELGSKIAAYREARSRAGYEPASGIVTLMLHTFIGPDADTVRQTVRRPFVEYLKSSVDLWRHGSADLNEMSEEERGQLFAYAFERYYRTSALFGSPAECAERIVQLSGIGVDEIACLVDFGIDDETVLAGLPFIAQTSRLVNRGTADGPYQPAVGVHPVVATARGVTDVQPAAVAGGVSVAAGLSSPGSLPVPVVGREEVAAWVTATIVAQVASTMQVDAAEVAVNQSFYRLGVSSVKGVEIINRLGSVFGIALSPVILFEASTPDKLSGYLLAEHASHLAVQYVTRQAGTGIRESRPPSPGAPASEGNHPLPTGAATACGDSPQNLDALSEEAIARLLLEEIQAANKHQDA